MGIYINGVYVTSEKRWKDGKADGFNVLVAVGTEAYRIKVSDDVYNSSSLAAVQLGQQLSFKVKFSAFREKVYFTAEEVEVVEA